MGGIRHTGHEVWTGFLSNHKSGGTEGLKDHGVIAPYHLVTNFVIGQVAESVTLHFLNFASHRSSACLQVILLSGFGDPITCRFTCWVPGFMPTFLQRTKVYPKVSGLSR